MDDKRYNVWCIKNKENKFYHEKYVPNGRTNTGRLRMKFEGIEWVDDFKCSGFFNYRKAESIVNELNIAGLTIHGYDECKKKYEV